MSIPPYYCSLWYQVQTAVRICLKLVRSSIMIVSRHCSMKMVVTLYATWGKCILCWKWVVLLGSHHVYSSSSQNIVLLHSCAITCHICTSSIRVLVKFYLYRLNEKKQTPLHIAVIKGNLNIIDLLIINANAFEAEDKRKVSHSELYHCTNTIP